MSVGAGLPSWLHWLLPSMLIFFSGSDGYRSRTKVRELKTEYLKKNPGGTGLFEIDFEAVADQRSLIKRLKEMLESQGLFATKKFVVARGVFSLKTAERESFQKFLETRPDILEKDSPMILLIWETGMAKKTEVLFKFLQKQASLIQSFDTLTGVALERFALVFLKQLDPPTTITRPALVELLSEVRSDLFRLDAELIKLANYAGEQTITSEMVHLLVPQESLHDAIWGALDAVASGDVRLATRLFTVRLEAGENALGMLALCAWQLRQIALVVDAYHAQGARDERAIAQVTGLKPFVIGKFLRRVQLFTPERIRKGFSLLSELDAGAKAGGLDPTLALELFVMRF